MKHDSLVTKTLNFYTIMEEKDLVMDTKFITIS